MSEKKNPWFKKEKRIQQLENYVKRSQSARFGYASYHESDKLERVNKHFNTVATRYDIMNTILSFGIHHLWKRKSVDSLQISPGDTVLDACGGTGDMASLAARRTGSSGLSIVYDINRKMIEHGQKKEFNNVLFVQGNAENLSFPDESIDKASIGFGIRNLTHLDTGFKELFRVLKKGGKMCCLEFSKPDNRYFRYLYDFYSFQIMPILGQLFTGSKEAYTVFPESIRTFPLPEELNTILANIGFTDIQFKKLSNGIAVLHICTK